MSAIMWSKTQAIRIPPVTVVRIVSILAIFCGVPSYCLAFDSNRLLEGDSGGGQFRLLHWSHPEAPHHVPGLSFAESVRRAVQTSKERVAFHSARVLATSLGSDSANDTSPTFVSPVFRDPYLTSTLIEYATEISIGTPPRTFNVLADTGSDLVWVQCSHCELCEPQPDPLYNPAKSSTFTKLPCSSPFCPPVQIACVDEDCEYEYVYGAGTIAGYLGFETITLTTTTGTTTTANDFAFGCNLVDDTTPIDLDGIVGLGQGPLSFTSQLGNLFGNKFSYCLVSIFDRNNSTSPLFLGDEAVPTGPTQYTAFVQNVNDNTSYYIGLTGIKVNGVALDIPPGTFNINPEGSGGTIVDSGTSFSSPATPAYSLLLEKIKSLINYPVIPYSNVSIGLDLCYDVPQASYPEFPNVTMVFDGFSLDLPMENVFVGGLPGLQDNGTYEGYCLGFTDGGDFTIFGNVQQQNFQILFDRKAKQFGFSKVQCNKLTAG